MIKRLYKKKKTTCFLAKKILTEVERLAMLKSVFNWIIAFWKVVLPVCHWRASPLLLFLVFCLSNLFVLMLSQIWRYWVVLPFLFSNLASKFVPGMKDNIRILQIRALKYPVYKTKAESIYRAFDVWKDSILWCQNPRIPSKLLFNASYRKQ